MPWTSTPQPQPSLYSDTKRYLSRNFGLPIQTLDVVLTITATCSVIYVYRNYLKRIPDTAALPPHFFRKRTLYGRVVSVGDADNFRLYHTPGGKWMGWGWLPGRRVPESRKKLKGQTLHIRIAGVDAPEASHFGKVAQPYSTEALTFLTDLLLNRTARVALYRRDQYERVVCSARVRRHGILGLVNFKQDVGLAMLAAGAAQVYESKMGAEFGKAGMEAKYRAAEEKAKKARIGMWGVRGAYESPGEYKKRLKEMEAAV